MTTPLPLTDDADMARLLEAMRLLAAQPVLSQRELSRALGLSLGKRHSVLHVLLDSGLVKFQTAGRSRTH